MAIISYSYALLGASGCGKTTLLRCCLGFIRPNKGNIAVLGNPPDSRGTSIPGKDLGYMPQVMCYCSKFLVPLTLLIGNWIGKGTIYIRDYIFLWNNVWDDI